MTPFLAILALALPLTARPVSLVWDTPPSAPLVIPPPLVWIQKSVDLQTWENVVQIPYVEGKQFIRIQLPPTP